MIVYSWQLSVLISAQENEETHIELDRDIEIPEGWSMFGYTCSDPIDVVESFVPFLEQIEIIKDENGSVWYVECGFNGITALEYGKGYQIKTFDAIENFQFCPNIE